MIWAGGEGSAAAVAFWILSQVPAMGHGVHRQSRVPHSTGPRSRQIQPVCVPSPFPNKVPSVGYVVCQTKAEEVTEQKRE